MSDPHGVPAVAGTKAVVAPTSNASPFRATVTSSVVFVSDLDRSVKFYCDVFACELAIHEKTAALLLDPKGFQMYLMARGDREEHPTGGIGHEYLAWAVDTPDALDHFAQALKNCGGYVDRHTSGGVQFVEGRDPDGIRVVIAYPTPQQVPRSVLDPRFYE
ncbi:MAG: VOC family protein [Terracoccus sp.]